MGHLQMGVKLSQTARRGEGGGATWEGANDIAGK